MSYRDLTEKLTAMGIPATESNIDNEISRGAFATVFFVQCLMAIGARTMLLHEAD